MRGVVKTAVPVCYVNDVDRSRDFYVLFGFVELRSGDTGESRWTYMQCGDTLMLLAAVYPPVIAAPLPLLIYLYVDDIDAVAERLTAEGLTVDRVGYPDHAPGGECRTVDPDGNVVQFGQRTAVPIKGRAVPTEDDARLSLMREAAQAVSRRGGAPARCQIGGHSGEPCTDPADVKLADPWGETVWGCMLHADEALITARSAFIATEDGLGLGEFLRNRRRSRTEDEA